MTQEDKNILLKDLSARLPYGVKVTDGLRTITLNVRIDTVPAALIRFMQSENLRYYLRPMSSMTEEERTKKDELFGSYILDNNPAYIDWLNAHHFDYRGLIEKGLALEAPEEMYKNE